MGNLILSLKKVIINKNSVTILGLILCIFIIFYSYNKRVSDSINPITVPYAKTQILSGTQITNKMVGITQVPPSMLEGDVITNVSDVVDKYTNADTMIPEGSLFYKRAVVAREDLPANIILDYPTGYVLYNMKVNTESTYGNQVYPGNYIDIYLKVETQSLTGDITNKRADDKVMVGKMFSHVKVISVLDKDGNAIFKKDNNAGPPAMIIFAIPEEYYILLTKAFYLRSYYSTLIPVPTNESLKESPGELEMSSEYLKEWINAVTIWTDN
ncbi:MAG: hypothetical protein Q4E69_00050 [Bacilli bacterium]|nr:hypothetical protein [Bacilli bacterium]